MVFSINQRKKISTLQDTFFGQFDWSLKYRQYTELIVFHKPFGIFVCLSFRFETIPLYLKIISIGRFKVDVKYMLFTQKITIDVCYNFMR